MLQFLKKISLFIIFQFLTIIAMSQNLEQQAQAPKSILYQDGKIFVVFLVLLIILVGIFIYLITLDRKITKLLQNK
ncbi:MAG: hypothetical protein QM528_01275 [Phycisphaerales bacterium]|nr:hypothetical protein [Phycisphaerales bacterium]